MTIKPLRNLFTLILFKELRERLLAFKRKSVVIPQYLVNRSSQQILLFIITKDKIVHKYILVKEFVDYLFSSVKQEIV